LMAIAIIASRCDGVLEAGAGAVRPPSRSLSESAVAGGGLDADSLLWPPNSDMNLEVVGSPAGAAFAGGLAAPSVYPKLSEHVQA